MDITKTWYIIVNPHAGSGKTVQEWEIAEKMLSTESVSYVSVFTDHKSHAQELAFDAAGNGYRRFLAVGGDGSVHEILNGLMKWCSQSACSTEDFTLGVIPIGSGNDWIKSFGIPRDTATVVKLVAEERTSRQDVIRVTTAENRTCYMANIGGTGFDAHVCERVNAQKEAGHRNRRIYVNALIHTALGLRSIAVDVICDGNVVFSGDCYSIAFGNGRFSGGGMRQTDKAILDDGMVDVMIVPKVSVARILLEVHRIFDGSTDGSRKLIYARGREVKVSLHDSQLNEIVEIDGECVGKLPISVRATGKFINVVSAK